MHTAILDAFSAYFESGRLALCKSTKNKAKGVKIAYARHEDSTTLGLIFFIPY